MFMQGDIVRYVGSNPALKKGDVSRGEVLAPMGNEPGVYVVEFGNEEAYVVPEASLTRYVASIQDLEKAAKEPEVVQKKRRRSSDDD